MANLNLITPRRGAFAQRGAQQKIYLLVEHLSPTNMPRSLFVENKKGSVIKCLSLPSLD